MQLNRCFRSVGLMIMTLVLSIGVLGCSDMNSRIPSPVPSSTGAKVGEMRETVTRSLQFPEALGDTLQKDLSQRTGIAAEKLRVAETTPKTWPNGCLGLAKPDEICTQMLVDGWQVVLSDGDRQWVYHTDRTGRSYRLQAP